MTSRLIRQKAAAMGKAPIDVPEAGGWPRVTPELLGQVRETAKRREEELVEEIRHLGEAMERTSAEREEAVREAEERGARAAGEQIAEATSTSTATVKRRGRYALAWLHRYRCDGRPSKACQPDAP